jgi:hypothetical protein
MALSKLGGGSMDLPGWSQEDFRIKAAPGLDSLKES